MGTVGDAYDNATAEWFFSIIQRELFDRQRWTTREELASAIFEYSRHRGIITTTNPSGKPGEGRGSCRISSC
jgi:hypothetical protein